MKAVLRRLTTRRAMDFAVMAAARAGHVDPFARVLRQVGIKMRPPAGVLHLSAEMATLGQSAAVKAVLRRLTTRRAMDFAAMVAARAGHVDLFARPLRQ